MPNPLMSAPVDETAVALDIVPITPNDSTDLATPARAIRCKNTGTSGAVALITFMGNTRTTDIAAGETLPVYATRVLSTGTTATGLEALV